MCYDFCATAFEKSDKSRGLEQDMANSISPHKDLEKLLRKLPKSHQQVLDIFYPQPVAHREFPNILVGFPGFEDWLIEDRFQHDVPKELAQLVRTYERVKSVYKNQVMRELDK